MATEELISLAKQLYTAVETVKGNVEQCDEIRKRVKRLLPALEGISSSGKAVCRT